MILTAEQYCRLCEDRSLRVPAPADALPLAVNPPGAVGEVVMTGQEDDPWGPKWQVAAVDTYCYAINLLSGYVWDAEVFVLAGLLLTCGTWYYEVELVEIGRWFDL
eukprot:CAMPEP_0172758292 /NCGR_PEP_ID=MMETSP1074-20121228/165455_1 /TAXON_ID=2916 /ORGANISM="Ceratium fusus, Strain PA161109" /LENGTH=105 /DNA_ID=CAMNT_0013591861 /DNA_START=100 /DNA_END=414 /DNA_ORIENTATION=-